MNLATVLEPELWWRRLGWDSGPEPVPMHSPESTQQNAHARPPPLADGGRRARRDCWLVEGEESVSIFFWSEPRHDGQALAAAVASRNKDLVSVEDAVGLSGSVDGVLLVV